MNQEMSQPQEQAQPPPPPPPPLPSSTPAPPIHKPNLSYGSMICQALHSKEKLTVSEIYDWIKENYPYYSSDDSGWQSSIRYNLSHHKCFSQIPKNDPSQKGGLWYYNPLPNYQFEKGILTKRRIPNDSRFPEPQKPPQIVESSMAGPSTVSTPAVPRVDDESQRAQDRETRKRRSTTGETSKPKEPRLELGEEGNEIDPEKRVETLSKDAGENEEEEENELEKRLDQAMKGISSEDSAKLTSADQVREGDAESSTTKTPDDKAKPKLLSTERFSFAKILASAIAQAPERKMSLASIYTWFSGAYPQYCKNNESSWKNSIRHNLSYYPVFIKLPRNDSEGGKGSFWSLTDTTSESPSPGRARRPKYMKELMKVKEDGTPVHPEGSNEGNFHETPTRRTRTKRDSVRVTTRKSKLPLAEPSQVLLSQEEGETPKAPKLANLVDGEAEPEISKVVDKESEVPESKTPPVGEEKEAPTTLSTNELLNQTVMSSVDDRERERERETSPIKISQEGGEGENFQETSVVAEAQLPEAEYYTNEAVRPPFSYSFLIGQAITSQPQQRATLSEIIEWLMQTYPYFRVHNNSWHNSIRNILSVKPFFMKLPKSDVDLGKGAYWTIAPFARESFLKGAHFKAGKYNLKYKKEPNMDPMKEDLPRDDQLKKDSPITDPDIDGEEMEVEGDIDNEHEQEQEPEPDQEHKYDQDNEHEHEPEPEPGHEHEDEHEPEHEHEDENVVDQVVSHDAHDHELMPHIHEPDVPQTQLAPTEASKDHNSHLPLPEVAEQQAANQAMEIIPTLSSVVEQAIPLEQTIPLDQTLAKSKDRAKMEGEFDEDSLAMIEPDQSNLEN